MSDQSVSYSTYELYPDGSGEYVGSFSLDVEESSRALERYELSRYNISGKICDYAIIIVMFETIYQFTKGPNGFTVSWMDNQKTDGFIGWRGNTWRIKKVEDDVSE